MAAVCSPYRHRTMASGTWIEELTALNADGAGSDLTPISGLEGLPGGSRLAAPAEWGGPFGASRRCAVRRARGAGTCQLSRDALTRSGWT